MNHDDFRIDVRDRDLKRVAQIDPMFLPGAIVAPKKNAVGSWQIVLPAVVDGVAHPATEALKTPGAGIVAWAKDENGAWVVFASGSCENADWQSSPSDLWGEWTFTGPTDEQIIAGALAYPQPSVADPAAQTRQADVRTGPAERVLRGYAAYNIIPAYAPAGRVIGLRSKLVLAGSNAGRGPTRTASARFDNLLGLMRSVAAGTDMVFSVRQSGEALRLLVAPSTDLTGVLRFDMNLENLDSQATGFSAPTANVVIAAGQVEDATNRAIAVASDAAAVTSWGYPKEVFIDQSSETEVAEVEKAALVALLEGSAGSDATVIPSADAQGLVPSMVGATVSVVVNGVLTTAMLNQVIVSFTESGVSVAVTLGNEDGSDWESQVSAELGSISDRLSKLERFNSLEQITNTAFENANIAIGSATTANGRVTISPDAPTVALGAGRASGSLWYRRDSSAQVIGMWEWDGAAWVPRTFTDAVLSNLDAASISVGTLDSARIAAGSITVDKLLVGPGNMLPWDPFAVAPHTGATGTTLTPENDSIMGQVIAVSHGSGTNGTFAECFRFSSGTTARNGLGDHFNVVPGESYRFRVGVGRRGPVPSGMTADDVKIELGVTYWNAAGVHVGSAFSGARVVPFATADAAIFNLTVTPNALGQAVSARIFLRKNFWGSSQLKVKEASFVHAVDGSLIVDGSIVGKTITGGKVIGTEIIGGTITGGSLETNSDNTARRVWVVGDEVQLFAAGGDLAGWLEASSVKATAPGSKSQSTAVLIGGTNAAGGIGQQQITVGSTMPDNTAGVHTNRLHVVEALWVGGVDVTPAYGDSGWVQIFPVTGFTGASLSYRRIGNVVHLRGSIAKNAGNFSGTAESLFTLPASARPAAYSRFPAATDGAATADITISGGVVSTRQFGTTLNSKVYFAGVSFLVG